jgi:hypothetical protein
MRDDLSVRERSGPPTEQIRQQKKPGNLIVGNELLKLVHGNSPLGKTGGKTMAHSLSSTV